jgi:hypothetical protein
MRTDAPRVRRPALTGVVPVAALWWPSWLPVAVREARLLAAWRPGARAWRFPEGDLVEWPEREPAPLDCSRLGAWPLLRLPGGRLASAPLGDDELAALPADRVVVVLGAAPLLLARDAAHAFDPAQLIEADDYALHDTYDCSAVLVTPEASRLEGKAPRAVLGAKAPPPSGAQQRFVSSLARGDNAVLDAAARAAPTATPASVGERMRGLAGLAQELLALLAAFGASLPSSLLRLPGGNAAPSRGSAARDAGAIPPRSPPPRPSAWRQLLTRLALLTRVSNLFGWAHARYFRELLKSFEDGDLDAALRHALPIDSDRADLGQAFGTPGRREDLRLSATRPGGAVRMGLGDPLTDYLRQLYRRAFEQLDRQGRIDEAVFVLAELLNARQEALDYLERHGRAAEAAELALGWEMPAATIVRLLLLAGDWQRAVQVARRDHAFEPVIAAIGKQRPELVAPLRLAWGESLADRGEWLAAVDAIWPVAEARHLAIAWLDAAERADVAMTARALVQRAVLMPETLGDHESRLIDLVVDDAAADARAEMAAALLAVVVRNDAVRRIATLLLAPLAADRAENRNHCDRNSFEKLAELARDPLLRADLPDYRLPARAALQPLAQRTSPLEVMAPDAGTLAILDVVALTDERWLVALGEAGAMVVDHRGHCRQRWDVPAYRLVISANRRVALALAPRESVTRISRIDLVAHRVGDLGMLPIEHAAAEFDGLTWRVVSRGRLLLVDTGRPGLAVVWSIPEPPGPVLRSHFGVGMDAHLLAVGRSVELWRYAGAQRRLIARTEVLPKDDHRLLLAAGGVQQVRIRYDDATALLILDSDDGRRSLTYQRRLPEPPAAADCLPWGDGVALVLTANDQCLIDLVVSGSRRALTLEWPSDPAPRLRDQTDRLLACDARGRIVDIEVGTGTVRRLRLTG